MTCTEFTRTPQRLGLLAIAVARIALLAACCSPGSTIACRLMSCILLLECHVQYQMQLRIVLLRQVSGLVNTWHKSCEPAALPINRTSQDSRQLPEQSAQTCSKTTLASCVVAALVQRPFAAPWQSGQVRCGTTSTASRANVEFFQSTIPSTLDAATLCSDAKSSI